MKRSNEPIFWSLFGAGGMLSALVGVALVFVTGIGVPLALLVSPELMQYQSMLEFLQHWPGKIIVFAIIVLFLWHAALRILNMLHDFGVHAGAGARLIGYGLTLLCTIATAYWLLALGS
jgi:fumarate reductase subunit D